MISDSGHLLGAKAFVVDLANEGARGFYEKYGFASIPWLATPLPAVEAVLREKSPSVVAERL
jgi:hypothetical protein